MMIGEGAVDLAVQRDDLGADRFQQARCDIAGHAVAGIHHHLDRAVQLHVVGDALDVGVADVALFQLARRCRGVQAAFVDALVQFGDRRSGQGLAADHDLEAVVVGRIVAAGDRHAAAGAQFVGAEIHHWSGRQADVDHLAAGAAQAVDQAIGELRAR